MTLDEVDVFRVRLRAAKSLREKAQILRELDEALEREQRGEVLTRGEM